MVVKILGALLAVSVLVVVHEFGHYLFARLFKVGVPVFSIGMGPRIGGFRWRGTDFRISVLPIGGYVQMAGADPFGESDPDTWVPPEQDFMRKPVWQRLIIMFAGPAFNLVMPLFLLTFVLWRGDMVSDATVGAVHPGTPAAAAGLRAGDIVLAVNATTVQAWGDVAMALEKTDNRPVDLFVRRDGKPGTLRLPAGSLRFTEDGWVDLESIGMSHLWVSSRIGVDDPRSPAGRAGLRTGDQITTIDGEPVAHWVDLARRLRGERHEVTYKRAVGATIEEGAATLVADGWAPRKDDPYDNAYGVAPVMVFVGSYTRNSAAEAAGLMPDDRIVAVDGKPIAAWSDLLTTVSATGPPDEEIDPSVGGCLRADPKLPEPRELTLSVVRAGERLDLTLRPTLTRELVRTLVRYRPIMGVERYPDAYIPGGQVMKRYGVLEAIPLSVEDTVAVLTGTIDVLTQYATGGRRLDETVGGPIAIVQLTSESAGLGLNTFIRMVATISVGLGLINLLPVPALDGGQIVFYAIEGVRGRPLPLALRERIQMIGVLFLVALILVVSVNDVSRLLSGG